MLNDVLPDQDRDEVNDDREERLANIRWFSRLSPSEKIRVIEMHNRATKRLRELRGRAR